VFTADWLWVFSVCPVEPLITNTWAAWLLHYSVCWWTAELWKSEDSKM